MARFKPLTKTQYEALSHGERINYIAAAIQARASDLYVDEARPSKAPPRKPPRARRRA